MNPQMHSSDPGGYSYFNYADNDFDSRGYLHHIKAQGCSRQLNTTVVAASATGEDWSMVWSHCVSNILKDKIGIRSLP